MRFLSKLALMALLIAVAPAAFAQGGATSTIAVEQPWARATPAGALTGAAYMTLANKTQTADRLTAASSDVAAKVQIHEMAVVNGIMQMRQLTDGLAIPAGGSVTLKPGSYHVMLIGLKKRLVAGQTFAHADLRESREYFRHGADTGHWRDPERQGRDGRYARRQVRRHGQHGDEVMDARQWVITAVAGVAGFAVAGLALMFTFAPQHREQSAGVPAIGGPFTLVDDTGATVTDKTLAGKPYAIYFGYTYCPEVCPTTLVDLTRWIKELGPNADKLDYVFVTIDPERDTPKLMHQYLASFERRIRGFSGTPAQIARIAKEYRVYYKKIPTSDGSYLMDHSAMIYLMTADERFDTVIPYQEKDATALTKLRNLVATAPSS